MKTKEALKEYLRCDSKNYTSQVQIFWKKYKNNLLSNPISDQKYIWLYIKALRHVEYYQQCSRFKFLRYWWLRKLRKLSYKTGFQIPPHTCGKGLTIWHWGSIIINPATRIGQNCTLYPGVLIGQKDNEGAPNIGDNCFIGAGAKIIGPIKIGNNVIIGANCLITKDVEDNSIVVCNNQNNRYL